MQKPGDPDYEEDYRYQKMMGDFDTTCHICGSTRLGHHYRELHEDDEFALDGEE